MKLTVQKRLAAKVLKCSEKNIVFDTEKLASIKEAMTTADVKDLINSNIIRRNSPQSQSRSRARKIQEQKRKGLRKGLGSRKGTAKARLNPKGVWIAKVRLQRSFIKELREKSLITIASYRNLYSKTTGNFFRNKKHIKQYIEDSGLFEKNGKQ